MSTPLTSPDLAWNDQGLPVSGRFDDVYFSKEDGLEESRYVFLDHNGIPERWQETSARFTIFETGFGTGLNFLLTRQAWKEHRQSPGVEQNTAQHLHYISVEKYPLNREELRQALSLWPHLMDQAEDLINQYPLPVSGFHSLRFPDEHLTLTLIFDDVKHAVQQISGPVDTWYLDGFAPSRNPEMWSEELFRNMARLSLPGTTVATFTAAGLVKRGLKGAGFTVSKVKGFGRKREMLCGHYHRTTGPVRQDFRHTPPWMSPPQRNPGRIAIIGAGIAGSTTAWALSQYGKACDIFDTNGPGTGASGNPQGALYAKLAAGEATHTAIYVQGFLQSLRWMEQHLEKGSEWNDCGLLQLAPTEKEKQRQLKFAEQTDYPHQMVHSVDPEEASKISGIDLEHGGLFFPGAGWVSPRRLCEKLTNNNTTTLIRENVSCIRKTSTGWQIDTEQGTGYEYDTVIVASAVSSRDLLSHIMQLPVRSIRGQLTYVPEETGRASELKTVLCAKGYVSPAQNGQFCLGATYHIEDPETAIRPEDHSANLNHLHDFGTALSPSEVSPDTLDGRVAFRCTTPDYLPIAGPVLDESRFMNEFDALRKNATRYPHQQAPFMEGLYINTGHGSRGLSSAPLCAELIAAYVCGESLPVSLEHAGSLHPGRFLIRDMIRKKR